MFLNIFYIICGIIALVIIIGVPGILLFRIISDATQYERNNYRSLGPVIRSRTPLWLSTTITGFIYGPLALLIIFYANDYYPWDSELFYIYSSMLIVFGIIGGIFVAKLTSASYARSNNGWLAPVLCGIATPFAGVGVLILTGVALFFVLILIPTLAIYAIFTGK